MIPLVEGFVKAVGIFLAFWLGGKIVEILICRVRSAQDSQDLVNVLGRTAKITLVVFGLITALGTVGLNVQALVAGLGLTGFALGFAFRDVLSNLLAGVLILLYKPFKRGDYVVTAGLEGTVTRIDLRYTALEHGDNLILIPNASLFTNAITVTRHPQTPADQVQTGTDGARAARQTGQQRTVTS